MIINVSNEIEISSPTQQVITYCKNHLTFNNPEYISKTKLGLWIGDTPKKVYLYKYRGEDLIVPYGCLTNILEMCKDDDLILNSFSKHERCNYKDIDFGLRTYQELALDKMFDAKYGILEARAGSGKTQIGLALINKIHTKALWVTHTIDLLNQSLERAKQYFGDDRLLGVITDGKVKKIGDAITFATVQTLSKIDLDMYKNEWDVIIVDECHRVSANVNSVNQFQKVLTRLSAKHKYGLSATLHRADNMIGATFALLGDIKFTIPKEMLDKFIMQVGVKPKVTPLQLTFDSSVDSYVKYDGTIKYANLVSYIANDITRNDFILNDLRENKNHYNLILGERLDQLYYLYSKLDENDAVILDGRKRSREDMKYRELAIESLRMGKKHYLFATYKLAKEGLDIPRLDRVYLVTPQKDSSVIEQSIGRVARTFMGKDNPICYDYIDDCQITVKYYKHRRAIYKKNDCYFIE